MAELSKYCRVRKKVVKIDEGPFNYICEESFPTKNACEESRCVYHNVMVTASAIKGILGTGQMMSREDFKRVAILTLGAVDYCEDV